MSSEPEPQPELDLPEDDWAHAFFAAYTGTVRVNDGSDYGSLAICNRSKSAKHAGVHPKTIAYRRDHDPAFADLLQQADEALTEAVEQVAVERILNGTERPVFQHGEIVGHIRVVDNRLLQWWLERRATEKYHIATRVEHVNPDTPGAFVFRLGDKPLELEAGEEAAPARPPASVASAALAASRKGKKDQRPGGSQGVRRAYNASETVGPEIGEKVSGWPSPPPASGAAP